MENLPEKYTKNNVDIAAARFVWGWKLHVKARRVKTCCLVYRSVCPWLICHAVCLYRMIMRISTSFIGQFLLTSGQSARVTSDYTVILTTGVLLGQTACCSCVDATNLHVLPNKQIARHLQFNQHILIKLVASVSLSCAVWLQDILVLLHCDICKHDHGTGQPIEH